MGKPTVSRPGNGPTQAAALPALIDPHVIDPPPAALMTHRGQGGSYVRDPVTGSLTLVQRTEPCPDCTLTTPNQG